MIRVGLTGGIGSGKSTVAEVWESKGAYILNADDLAKKIMVNDPEVRQQLTETFGEESFKPDGSLNRAWLADQAFRKDRVDELNRIVHPKIPAATRRHVEEAERMHYDLFVFEAALLLQNLRPGEFDYIVMVLADEDRRVQWVSERDDVAGENVRDRIESQQDFSKLTDQADFIIENDGTLDELKRKAEELYKTLTREKHRSGLD